MDVALALESVMESVLVPPVPIVDGLKLLATVGGGSGLSAIVRNALMELVTVAVVSPVAPPSP